MRPETDLAIVVNVYNYGQYLNDWARSILTLERRPARIAIFEHGSTDASAQQADAAGALLAAAGLSVVVEHHATKLDFGTARNHAVSMAGELPWIMHFDADDELLPHALSDVAALADNADVVCMGYERDYSLMGRRPDGQRSSKTYRSTTGEAALMNSTPASGVSPFRRELWLQTPYRPDLIGGWDTALWRDFARQGARFVATRRPGFRYRQHADSVFNTRRRSGWPAARAGAQLASAQRGDTGVTVIVPRSAGDGPARVAAWHWVRQRYARLHPTWQVLEGMVPAGASWCKGDAVARALPEATGRTLVIADADCVVQAEALERAVHLVESGAAPWVVPHRLVHRLGQQATARLLAADPGTNPSAPAARHELVRAPYVGFAGGGLVVVNRPVFTATGGIPSRFVGWGAEDEALALILDTLVGRHERLEYDLVHLWHEPQPRVRPEQRQNRQFLQRLQLVAREGDAERLWAMVRNGHSTYSGRPAAAVFLPAGALGRRPRRAPNAQDMAMHDAFAQRRLAKQARRNHKRQEPVPMAGARDIMRYHTAKTRENQRAINAAAEAEAEKGKAEGRRLAGLSAQQHRSEINKRRHKARQLTKQAPELAAETKMLEGPPENKGSGVTITDRRQPRPSAAAPAPAPAAARQKPAVSIDSLTFASPAAKALAHERGITAEQLQALKQGPKGITVKQVRELEA